MARFLLVLLGARHAYGSTIVLPGADTPEVFVTVFGTATITYRMDITSERADVLLVLHVWAGDAIIYSAVSTSTPSPTNHDWAGTETGGTVVSIDNGDSALAACMANATCSLYVAIIGRAAAQTSFASLLVRVRSVGTGKRAEIMNAVSPPAAVADESTVDVAQA